MFIAVANIIPFGFYAYSYWKFTIYFSKTDVNKKKIKNIYILKKNK
jgi:hypothetical protein